MRDNYWIIGLAFALVMAGAVSLYASTNPDGLEWVMEQKGLETATGHLISSPMPDYKTPGIEDEAASAAFAGATGTVLLFLIGILLGRVLKKKTEDGKYSH